MSDQMTYFVQQIIKRCDQTMIFNEKMYAAADKTLG